MIQFTLAQGGHILTEKKFSVFSVLQTFLPGFLQILLTFTIPTWPWMHLVYSLLIQSQLPKL